MFRSIFKLNYPEITQIQQRTTNFHPNPPKNLTDHCLKIKNSSSFPLPSPKNFQKLPVFTKIQTPPTQNTLPPSRNLFFTLTKPRNKLQTKHNPKITYPLTCGAEFGVGSVSEAILRVVQSTMENFDGC
jgi:hypothetical protein